MLECLSKLCSVGVGYVRGFPDDAVLYKRALRFQKKLKPEERKEEPQGSKSPLSPAELKRVSISAEVKKCGPNPDSLGL